MIDHQEINKDSKTEMVMELTSYLERRGRLPELVAICAQKRSHVSWEDTSDLVEEE